jgi:acyl-CoA synthetase (NDP forming)
MTVHATTIRTIIQQARSEGRTALDEANGKALLRQFGVSSPRSAIARDAADGARLCANMQGPFVVKVVSPEILHKSDAGGVALHLEDAAAVRQAIVDMSAKPRIAEANVEGWLVEEMIPKGCEIVIGGYNDPQFGPMMMVGLGGIFVEILKDVSFRICPIDKQMARDMLLELKGYALLEGARGETGVNIDALVNAMVAVGGADGLLISIRSSSRRRMSWPLTRGLSFPM